MSNLFIPQFKEINRNCLNNSSSKQIFTIPKQLRFRRDDQTQITSRSDFLDSPTSFAKSKAQSFTKSKRQLIFQHEEQLLLHPPPNLYNSSNFSECSKSGITIAKKLKPHYEATQKLGPGPAKYASNSFDRLNKSIRFSKSKRQFKYPLENRKGQGSPGPNLMETQKLRSILSKYKNVRQTKIPKKSNLVDLEPIKLKIKLHEQKLRQKMEYQSQKRIKLDSLNILKNSFSNINKSKTGFGFGTEPRKSYFDKKNNNPSPANYHFFSQFAQRNKPDTVNVNNLSSSRKSISIRSKTEVQQKKGRTVSAIS